MNTDDTGSWARPDPIDRTEPEFVDITRLAPAAASNDEPATGQAAAAAPGQPTPDADEVEIADEDLQPVDIDDVDPDAVTDEDIAGIMAGFERRAETADSQTPNDDEQPEVEQPSETSAATESMNDSSSASDEHDTADNAAPNLAPAVASDDDADSSPDASNGADTTDATNPTADEPAGAPAPSGFAALGLRPELVETLNDLGYEEPTPIQRETIPLLLTGRDLLGQAATGTGKTAAFALPALNALEPGFPDAPSVLVLTPTRELAVQVSEAIVQYGRKLGAKVVPVFGGQPIGRQLGALDRGAHVVVATPGRAIDHIGRGSLRLDKIKTVILDEADEMLDMGFTDDIESILESTPADRQTVMFSATMPPRINSIAKRHQRDPHKIKIGKAETQESQKLIEQRVYYIKRNDKPYALGRILDIETPDAAIVFCRTRMDVDQLTATMGLRGYRAEALHGGMDQTQRDRVMARLRDGTAELLVATDVAARGLDVDTLTHVVNYDVPSAAESYVHRIGRVGRAGREGTAITLADPRDRRQVGNIERLMKTTIEVVKVPSVADLRARQVEVTVNQIREALTAVDLEDFNKVLHALAGEDSDRNIALAAIKLVHESRGAVLDEREIPDASVRNDRSANFKDKRADGKGRHRDDREWDDNKSRGKKKFDRDDRKGKKRDFDNSDTAFVFLSLGRHAGVRPGDLVGAIANESGLTGRQIGPIRISEKHSVVGVPKDELDRVINAMDRSTMRGKPVKARPYTE
jgi:ATP-dependent RNA helicase DeaD